MSNIVKALISLAVMAGAVIPAAAQDRVAVGSLTCDVSAGFGLILGSRKEVSCIFTPASPGAQEFYNGAVTKLGVDIGYTDRSIMVWLVFAPTNRTYGALAGSYVGATAQATIAVGLGANALIGGFNRSVALQPLSVQGQTGLNVAAGVGELELRLAR